MLLPQPNKYGLLLSDFYAEVSDIRALNRKFPLRRFLKYTRFAPILCSLLPRHIVLTAHDFSL